MNEYFLYKKNKLNDIYHIISWAVSYFDSHNIWYGHGSDNSWDEAVQLILQSLHMSPSILETKLCRYISHIDKCTIIKRVEQRVNKRIPVSYLTNKAWFCGYEFYIDKRVVIPRSPIGELINNKFNGLITTKPKYILDMCTGSGCIAIACAYNFPETIIDAVDISLDALYVARFNIQIHNLACKVRLIHSDLFSKVDNVNYYDMILVNPPYVKFIDIYNAPKEYHYEPKLGLVSGINGLEIVNRILAVAANYLTDNGILICEIGDNMFDLIKMYPNVPFTWLEFDNGGEGVFMLTKEQLCFLDNILDY